MARDDGRGARVREFTMTMEALEDMVKNALAEDPRVSRDGLPRAVGALRILIMLDEEHALTELFRTMVARKLEQIMLDHGLERSDKPVHDKKSEISQAVIGLLDVLGT